MVTDMPTYLINILYNQIHPQLNVLPKNLQILKLQLHIYIYKKKFIIIVMILMTIVTTICGHTKRLPPFFIFVPKDQSIIEL